MTFEQRGLTELVNKSRSQKIERVIEFLTESHLDHFGGYPYDYAILGDKLIVAGLDGGKENVATELSVYFLDDLVEWYNDAVYEMSEEPSMDFTAAMEEFGRPPQVETDDIPD